MKNKSLIIASLLSANAYSFDYRNNQELSSDDYLYKERSEQKDSVFERYQTIELDVDLGVQSDCGRIDVKSTLKGTLNNLLDAEYFESLGTNLVASSPMLLTCYFSPTWCSILKNLRVNASALSKMRLDQCAMIDSYTDSRTEDYKKERQACVHQAIERNGGNMEKAMKQCNGGSNYSVDLANWAGSKFGDKSKKNSLIGSSAKWAGLDTRKSKKSLNLLKALVGDTVVGRGSVEVDYGPKGEAISPRRRLQEVEKDTFHLLCNDILNKIDRNKNRRSIDQLFTNRDLRKIGKNSEGAYIDKQTLRYLALMPYIQRGSYCRKLAHSIAMTKFSEEMNRSLDLLNVLEENPNLPDKRKMELAAKRRKLKDSVETTIKLQRAKNVPLNRVISKINQKGREYEKVKTRNTLNHDVSRFNARRSKALLFDCADGIFCQGGGN